MQNVMLLTIPVSVASGERSFFKVQNDKNLFENVHATGKTC